MASYRPFPSHPPAAPSQNPLPPHPPSHAQPPPPPPPMNPHQPYPQQLNFPGGAASAPSGYSRISSGYLSALPYGNQQQLPPPPPRPQQQQYPYAAPPPPPPRPAEKSGSYPPPPPPPQAQAQPPIYYPPSSSQYPPQYNPPAQPLAPPPPPPPPPSSPPPNPSQPPPPPPPVPPPSVPPPPPPPHGQSFPPAPDQHRSSREASSSVHHQKPAPPPKQEKPRSSRQPGGHNAPPVRLETEEERRLRKKREQEKQKQEERRQPPLKQPPAIVQQRSQMTPSGSGRPHGSTSGSCLADRRTAPLLSGERIDNRLKKPTTYICKMKFRNELPDPSAQPKLMSILNDKDRYSKYKITSLEKNYKTKLFVEPDLGIPLDLLDMSVYNCSPDCPPLSPGDEELLRGDEEATPTKKEFIKRKDRPTDKGVSWLVKTQYISPLSMDSAKLSLTEKQAKEMRESKQGRNSVLDSLNSREKKIQAIEESFRVAKQRPVHQTKPDMEPAEILPLLPDFESYDDQLVMVSFDGDPTAESEQYNKLNRSTRDELESQAIMKSYVVQGADPSKPEKFLAYMVPSADELSKAKETEDEEMSFSWIREYHWDVRGDDADDPTTYLVTFGDRDARYLPLPTKFVLQKKKAKEGRTGDEVEHFPVPSRVTVKRKASATGKSSGGTSGKRGSNAKRGRSSTDIEGERRHKFSDINDIDQFIDEEDMSD